MNCRSDLHIQVESVVEVSTPEEMGEAQADVKGTKLFFTQREQSEDVHKVLVPPEYDMHYKKTIKNHFILCRDKTGAHTLGLTHMYTHNLPQDFLTSRGQVAVNKPKRCSIEEEGDSNSPLVS